MSLFYKYKCIWLCINSMQKALSLELRYNINPLSLELSVKNSLTMLTNLTHISN